MNDAEVTFGGLDLLEGAGSPYLALSEGATPGSPAPFITSLRRQLLDGSIVTKEGDGNRVIQFSLLVTADDPLALAEAEAVLTAQVYARRNELRIKPPGLNTPVSVFETFVGEMRQDTDHDLYDPETRWVFDVVLPALPHAHSEAEYEAVLDLANPSGVTRLVSGTATVDGSVRSPQNVTVENSALGLVQILVCEPFNGFDPDMSQFLVSSVDDVYTADATKVSGGYFTGGTHTFEVPAATLRPVAYQLVAHGSLAVAGSSYVHTLASELISSGGASLSPETSTPKRVTAPASGWQFVTFGTVYPPAEVHASSTNKVRLTLSIEAAVAFDELWLVPQDAALLQVDGGTSTRLRVVAPSADYPNGAVFVGSSDADERSALGKSFGRLGHFEAGENFLHVVTTGGDLDPDTGVTVSGTPHWHTNAAK